MTARIAFMLQRDNAVEAAPAGPSPSHDDSIPVSFRTIASISDNSDDPVCPNCLLNDVSILPSRSPARKSSA